MAWAILIGLGIPVTLLTLAYLGTSTQGSYVRPITPRRFIGHVADGLVAVLFVFCVIAVVVGVVCLFGWAAFTALG